MLHLVGLILTYLSKMHGHSNINSKLAEKSELASGECYSTAKNLNRSRNNLGLEGGGGDARIFCQFWYTSSETCLQQNCIGPKFSPCEGLERNWETRGRNGGGKKCIKYERHNFHSLPNGISSAKWRRMKWARHVAHIGMIWSVCEISTGKLGIRNRTEDINANFITKLTVILMTVWRCGMNSYVA